MGATDIQIVTKVIIKEAIPGIISGIILTSISVVGYSAMGGALGAGGLGDVAIRYGYQAWNINYLVITSLILVIFVQIIQFAGNKIYNKLS